MKRYSKIILTVGILSIFLLSGCITQPPSTANKKIIAKAADLTVELEQIPYETLKKLYGSNRRDYQNPFIDFPGQVPQRRIVVFDAIFSTETSTIDVGIRTIQLSIGGQAGKAASAEYLSNLWKGYIKRTAWVNKLPDKAHRNMIPREFSIEPGEPVSGYLVFAERFPKEGGEGFMSIPVTSENGDRGTIEIEMYFSEGGTETAAPEANTGIFAEEDNTGNSDDS